MQQRRRRRLGGGYRCSRSQQAEAFELHLLDLLANIRHRVIADFDRLVAVHAHVVTPNFRHGEVSKIAILALERLQQLVERLIAEYWKALGQVPLDQLFGAEIGATRGADGPAGVHALQMLQRCQLIHKGAVAQQALVRKRALVLTHVGKQRTPAPEQLFVAERAAQLRHLANAQEDRLDHGANFPSHQMAHLIQIDLRLEIRVQKFRVRFQSRQTAGSGAAERTLEPIEANVPLQVAQNGIRPTVQFERRQRRVQQAGKHSLTFRRLTDGQHGGVDGKRRRTTVSSPPTVAPAPAPAPPTVPVPLWSTVNRPSTTDGSGKLEPWICTACGNFLLEPSMSTVFNEAPPPIFLHASIMLFTLLSNSATGL
ncbi:hypothetical protein T4E_1599 [Trichinella pseudospiralis]|uniref:Uncharacterized protein n=1 Tax=Trichinella pseudospiralis TaxID=6337 RepID=A0A0V0YMW3_TRIPS|nr:hypothetical protein T4E_1599 [Trichinella pseudospiralis]